MSKFRMNWHDFKNNRFQYGGATCLLGSRKKPTVKTRIMFLLNVYRGRWVATDDIIEFLYSERPPENWPEFQVWALSGTIYRMRRILPDGVKIVGSRSFGYKLETGQPLTD